MAGCEFLGAGGIVGLFDFLQEHREPIQYDLLQIGQNLNNVGTLSLSWWDLHVFLKYAPRTSALVREVNGEAVAEWTAMHELLRSMEYQLRMLVWQRTKDATKGLNTPEPLQPPEKQKPNPVMELKPDDGEGPHVMGHSGVTLERMAELLGWDPETGQRLDSP